MVAAGARTVFLATTEPTEQHLYALDHATGEIQQLSRNAGVHTGVVRTDLVAVSSETLDSTGVTVRVYQEGRLLATVGSLPREPAFTPQVTLLKSGERELRTAVIFPRDGYRPPGPLPVLMAPYGGPSQQVLKARRLFNEPQWLADHGFAVVVADGRGSPARGPAWERAFYLDVATPALDDQVAALESVMARYPGNWMLAGSACADGRSAGTSLPSRCCAGPMCSAPPSPGRRSPTGVITTPRRPSAGSVIPTNIPRRTNGRRCFRWRTGCAGRCC